MTQEEFISRWLRVKIKERRRSVPLGAPTERESKSLQSQRRAEKKGTKDQGQSSTDGPSSDGGCLLVVQCSPIVASTQCEERNFPFRWRLSDMTLASGQAATCTSRIVSGTVHLQHRG